MGFFVDGIILMSMDRDEHMTGAPESQRVTFTGWNDDEERGEQIVITP